MDATSLRLQIFEEAQKAFKSCLESLNLKSGTPMPPFAKVSVRKGYEGYVAGLVEITGRVAKDRVEGDVWVLWSMAQRASLPVKINTCITKGIRYYMQSVASSLPFFGQWILRDCLDKVHNDIVACWNFKDNGEVLNCWVFKNGCFVSLTASRPNPVQTNNPITLAASASTSLVPVVATPVVAALSARWLTMTLGQNFSATRRLLIAYIVDLIKLHDAFEAYAKSSSCQSIHESIRSKDRWIADDVGKEIRDLLEVDKYYTLGS
ncbi:hypothetical protein EI94DRAFT_746776 [Lactarius quietus]|nr:hypothetical protein EI94DRAFT_746776 [Lactarius quietus]